MFESYDYVMGLINPEDRVLDVGGWDKVFPRSNVVMDINPYETRGIVQPNEKEHFTKSDWIIGDLCTEEIWSRFKDKEFDLVICSHTLEDVRDPLFLCQQMIRVSKRGYIEVPSPFVEQCRHSPDRFYNGYDHHKWIVSVDDENRLMFTPKLSWAHDFDYGGDKARNLLASDHRSHFLSITWNDSFSYYERAAKGSCLESENIHLFYEKFDYSNPQYRFVLSEPKAKVETFWWIDQFSLPVEKSYNSDVISKRYHNRICNNSQSANSQSVKLGSKIRNFLNW